MFKKRRVIFICGVVVGILVASAAAVDAAYFKDLP